jgi:hypothetical protein
VGREQARSDRGAIQPGLFDGLAEVEQGISRSGADRIGHGDVGLRPGRCAVQRRHGLEVVNVDGDGE